MIIIQCGCNKVVFITHQGCGNLMISQHLPVVFNMLSFFFTDDGLVSGQLPIIE